MSCWATGDDPQEWMEFLKKESKAFGIPLFDILSDFRRLPVHEAVRMFIPPDQPGPNHFNDQGNAFVARAIYEKLMSHPSIAERPVLNDRTHRFGVESAYLVSRVTLNRRTPDSSVSD